MRPNPTCFVALCVLASLLARDACAADGKSEYYARLAAVPPRSAEAHVQLAEWCRKAGLEGEALECFQKAVSIDSDCEMARAALGYRRYGTGWLKEGEKAPGFSGPASAPHPASSGVAPSARAPAREASAADTTKLESPATAAPEPSGAPAAPQPTGKPEVTSKKVPDPTPAAGSAPQGPTTGAKQAPQGDAFAAQIEKKKAWAKAAAEKIQASFFTYEDGDFLVHSTLPASSREMKLLLLNLKGLRKVLAAVIGATGSTRIWPDKLQIVLLKSEPEYERFANLVDALPSAKNPEGAYVAGGRGVLVNPESEALARLLGESALKRLNGSDRWVGWWLEQGIAETVYAMSPAGQKKEHYAISLKYAADTMKADGDMLKIFNLLETASYKDKDATRNRALALSLLDFLFKKNRNGFHELIKTLKSDGAPAPPADSGSKEEFNAFHLSYISFQEKSLEASFHMSVSAIQERWKAYTLQAAEALKAQDAAKEKEKSDTQKNNKKGKGKGNQ